MQEDRQPADKTFEHGLRMMIAAQNLAVLADERNDEVIARVARKYAALSMDLISGTRGQVETCPRPCKPVQGVANEGPTG